MSVMITYSDAKPDLLDPEALEHYGIKGMKWGVRRTEEQLARARGAIKKSAKDQVDVYKKGAKKTKAAYKKSRAKTKKIEKARGEVTEQRVRLLGSKIMSFRPDAEKRAKAKQNHAKVKREYLTNPDRVTASMLTDGEKATAILLSVPGGLPSIAGATVALGAQELVTMGIKADVEYQTQKYAKKDAKKNK